MALFGQKRIYLDYAGATPVDPAAARAMQDALALFANPGAIHQEGVEAMAQLDESRGKIVRLFGVKPREIIFTSGATEANNLAILGEARRRTLAAGSLSGSRWVVSSIEHPSVLACFGEIERLGGTVAFVEPDEKGIVRAAAVEKALTRETVFVSVGWANGEIGTIQPLAEIGRAIASFEEAHKTSIVFHADAGQAPLYLASTIHSLRVDLLTLDSGKLYGPRGIGALYVGSKPHLAPILFGGAQERGLRAGTENIVLAAGFAEALVQTAAGRDAEGKRVRVLRDELHAGLEEVAPAMLVNGDRAHMLPSMLNISIPDIQSEYLTLSLDHAGVSISTKSACREGEERSSHIVEALGGPSWRPENTLRFSLGRETTKQEVRRALQIFGELMHKRESVGSAERG